jgi:tripartite-type tricarboxylate transporter receptor subunit TctC
MDEPTVVIENKAGAGGTIATGEVARAAPDGYTLTMGTTTTHAIAVAAYQNLAYDPSADFEPIALVAVAPYLLMLVVLFVRPTGLFGSQELTRV